MRLDDEAVERLRKRIGELPPGEFHLPAIWGEDWDRLYVGDKVRLGRDFLEVVRAGRLPGVEDTGRKKGGGRVYSWKG
ncbi:DUF1413 domain-containing protein [Afifella sp. IM 167]|uniref:DUF1413 domain-containing protein n=1 Tax=Afifella sp. IM 167 TaxID=2033586 RepID=UPI001CCA85DE|nr:DUF1413 domain-containing protein [Afifella sp. IM 167]MBZ8133130.1 DUF1413 domain-containing protein [Afifella sp. IM 167]